MRNNQRVHPVVRGLSSVGNIVPDELTAFKMNTFMELMFDEVKTGKLLEYGKVHIVIGNESCDLDSAISAVTYAYYRSWGDKSENNGATIFLPVLNMRREDFAVKRDIQYILQKANVDYLSLLFRDDFDFEQLVKDTRVEVTLVDHHVLIDSLACLKPFIRRIFDHRPKDEHNFNYDLSKVKFSIRMVGSCATLICEEIMLEDKEFLEENKNVAFLLYGPIILDTANFNLSAGRAKALDFEMASALNEILTIEANEVFRKEMYGNLMNAKTNVNDLTPLELLRIDIKFVGGIPVPAFPTLVKQFLKLPECENCLKSFCKANNTETLVLIGLTVENGVIRRDIAVYSLEPNDVHERLVENLVTSHFLLNLEMEETDISNCDLFIQHNARSSRKQIIPLIRESLMEDE